MRVTAAIETLVKYPEMEYPAIVKDNIYYTAGLSSLEKLQQQARYSAQRYGNVVIHHHPYGDKCSATHIHEFFGYIKDDAEKDETTE